MYVIVNQDGQFDTGNGLKVKETSPFLETPYPKQARQYQKQGWAQQIANRCDGRVQVIDQHTAAENEHHLSHGS